MDCGLLGSSVHGGSPGKNTGVGCHAPLKRVGCVMVCMLLTESACECLKLFVIPMTTDERESNVPNVAESS